MTHGDRMQTVASRRSWVADDRFRQEADGGRTRLGVDVVSKRRELPVDVPFVDTVDTTGFVVCDLPRVGLGVPLFGSSAPFAGPGCRSTKRYAHTEYGVGQRFKYDLSVGRRSHCIRTAIAPSQPHDRCRPSNWIWRRNRSVQTQCACAKKFHIWC